MASLLAIKLFTFDKNSLNEFGELAIETVISIARLVENTKTNTADILTAIKATLRILSLAVRGRIKSERAIELIQKISKRFNGKPGSSE